MRARGGSFRRAAALTNETIQDAIAFGARRLAAAGIDSPRLEARLLLAHALGCHVADLLDAPIRRVDTGPFAVLVDRRTRREPLALILGHREFWSLRFAVSPATLIPRPESETLIEAAMRLFPDRSAALRILDFGTGTGCLLLAALSEFPQAFGIGVDRVEEAAALARANAVNLGLAGRAAFVCGSWDDALSGEFDLILSNPPYIASDAIRDLMPDVRHFEPRSALDGGPDGLQAYRSIIPAIPPLLTAGGAAIIELGKGQAAAAGALANAEKLTISAVRDLAGTPRALVLRHSLP